MGEMQRQITQKALAARDYDIAQAKFEEANKIHATDSVLTGLRQVQIGRAARIAEAKKAEASQKQSETIKELVSAGNAAPYPMV